VSVLLLDHGADVVRVLEIFPSWREKSGRDLAKEHGDVVEKDEGDQSSDDTVGDVVWN